MQGNSWSHFSLPTRLHFEHDSSFKIGNFIAQFGDRAMLLSLRDENRNLEDFSILKNSLSKHCQGVIVYDDLRGDPDLSEIDSATYFTKKSHANVIVAYGGQQTFNLAKAISILATNTFFASDLFSGKVHITESPIPLVVIPVYPTLGDELLPSLVLLDKKEGGCRYFESELLFPVAAFYDSQIIKGLNPDEIARFGGSLISYSIESLLSLHSNILSSTLTLKSIELMNKSLFSIYENPQNEKLLMNMLWSSALTGMGLISSPQGANWATSVVLSQSKEINFYDALCILIPHMMEYYLTVAPNQFIAIAEALGEDVSDLSVIEAAIKAVEGVRHFFLRINLATKLSTYDIKKHHLSDIASKVIEFPQIQNSPRKLGKNEIESVLLAAY